MTHVTESHNVLPHFLGSADGKDKAPGTGLEPADQHADHLAVKVEHGAAALTALHRNIRPDMRGGKKFSLRLPVKTARNAEARRDVVVEGKADHHEG